MKNRMLQSVLVIVLLLQFSLSSTACQDHGKKRGRNKQDKQAPTSTLLSPIDGATVSGTITILGEGSDNVAVTRMELHIDGVYDDTDIEAPYSWEWNTTTTSDGPHTILVKAFDAKGNTSDSLLITVTVNNVVPSPNAWIPTTKGVDHFMTSITVFPYNAAMAIMGLDVGVPRMTVDAGDYWFIPENGLTPSPDIFESWSVLVSPFSTPGETVILSGDGKGRIWRSSNGNDWDRTVVGAATDHMIALRSDPNDSNVFYTGTGDLHAISWGQAVTRSMVAKSADKGVTWTVLYDSDVDPVTIPGDAHIFDLVVPKGNSMVLYAATSEGLFRKVEPAAFEPWNGNLPGTPYCGKLVIDENNPSRMYLTVRTQGLYFSDDAGLTWTLRNGAGTTALDVKAWARFFALMRVPRGNSYRLYVGDARSDGGGLYASDDDGTTWDLLTRYGAGGNMPGNWYEQANRFKRQGIAYLAWSPSLPNRLYACNYASNVYRSDDEGLTWEYLSAKTKPLNGELFYENNGISAETVTYISWDPNDPDRIYFGDADHGLLYSIDGGHSSRRLFGVTGSIYGASQAVVDPANTDRILLGGYLRWAPGRPNIGCVYFSEDRGMTWTRVGGADSPGGTGINGLANGRALSVVIIPNSPVANRVFLAGIDGVGVYRGRHNSAAVDDWTWEPIGLAGEGLERVILDPDQPHRAYAGGLYKVFRCDDVTAASPLWTEIGDSTFADRKIRSITLDTQSPRRLILTTERGCYATTSPLNATPAYTELTLSGNERIKLGQTVEAFQFQGKNIILVASRQQGVVRSIDGGDFERWNFVQQQDPGLHTGDLKNYRIKMVAYHPARQEAFCSGIGYGTHRRAMSLLSDP